MQTYLHNHQTHKKFVMAALLIFTISWAKTGTAQIGQTRQYRITAVNAQDNRIVSQSNILSVAPGLKLYMPNTFTPNGDGLNENYGAICQGVESFKMRIYNRWGELMFQSNSLDEKWDGRFKGELVSTGVFVYEVEAKGIAGGAVYKHGTITVVY
jgi:gliding motility-associated-like protein